MELPDFDRWTRDAEGNPVDWTRPPYRDGSIFRPTLEGDGRLDPAEHLKRVAEYSAIARGRVRITDDGRLEKVHQDPGRRRYEPDCWQWFIAEIDDG